MALSDLAVLKQAANEGKILVTHDKRSMSVHLRRYLSDGGTSPGVLVVIPQDAEVKRVIDTLVLIWAASDAEDWTNQIAKIPF